jgi:FeS assembly SUF system regulator
VLRITRLTDYAIVVLGAAARVAPMAFAARTAAEQTGLPLPAVKKILKSLVQKGVVESQRGISGGYRLSRPATQIALADIIEAIEGPFALTDCGQIPADGQRLCEYLKHCEVHSNWSRVNGMVRRALASVTLADMIGPGDRGLVSLRIRPRGGERGGTSTPGTSTTGTSTTSRKNSSAGRIAPSPLHELGRE